MKEQFKFISGISIRFAGISTRFVNEIKCKWTNIYSRKNFCTGSLYEHGSLTINLEKSKARLVKRKLYISGKFIQFAASF